MEYQKTEYFNNVDTFLFKNHMDQYFTAKVKFQNGYWFTETNLSYKASSLKCLNCKFIGG